MATWIRQPTDGTLCPPCTFCNTCCLKFCGAAHAVVLSTSFDLRLFGHNFVKLRISSVRLNRTTLESGAYPRIDI